MAFWSDPSLREPLRQNRWYINFAPPIITGEQQKKDIDKYRFALKECSKPEYVIETTSHVLLNHTFNYPKNVVWKPIQIKMASVRTEDDTLSSTLNSYLNFFGYTSPDADSQKQISKSFIITPRISIVQVDANGAVIEDWILYNPMITNVNYGSLSYENEGFVDISFTLTYDYASLAIYPGNINIAITSNTATGAGTVTLRSKNLTEEQVANKILDRAKDLQRTDKSITSIKNISPGFPGQDNN